MLDILEKWNRWGDNPLNSKILRSYTTLIVPYIHTEEIVVLTGPRRAGKSTILYQLIDVLEKEGLSKEAVFHMNFEEPRLSSNLTIETLDKLYESYREHIYPEGKAYLFLDEIQNVEEWERWVRARNETENVKIFITGSSAKLMSREISTLLTGRHLSFEILPLSFSEFLNFSQIEPPKHKRPVDASPVIKQALNNYIKWGGFPAVTLAKTEQHKRNILLEYFDDILYKDIVLRHQIRDVIGLRNIAVHLLSQTSKLISFQRVSNVFQMSEETTKNYCHYIQEAFVVEMLSYYSVKASIRQRHPQKVHAMDLGIRNTVSITNSKDEGRVIESLVYQNLRKRHGNNVFYWSGNQEIDFVIQEGNNITQLWQIAIDGLEDQKVIDRELNAFEEAKKSFPDAKTFLVTKSLPKNRNNFPCSIIPLWLFLLD